MIGPSDPALPLTRYLDLHGYRSGQQEQVSRQYFPLGIVHLPRLGRWPGFW